MNWVDRVRTGIAVTGLLATATCSTARQMVVPDDVSQNLDVIQITDRSIWSGALADESFVMGPYRLIDVDRHWNQSSQWSIFNFSSGRTRGGYTYKFEHSGGSLQGQCTTEIKEIEVGLFGSISVQNQIASLGCRCLDNSKEVSTAVLRSGTSPIASGTVRTQRASYSITALYGHKGMLSSGNPSGYRVDGDEPIGAVEVLNPGRVWLAPSVEAEEHSRLACLFSGLMLYSPK